MSAAVVLTIDARAGLTRVAGRFARLPQATVRAQQRALRKLATWLKRQVLREAARGSGIAQAWFQQAMRYFVTLQDQGLQIWLGTEPIKAHRLGTPVWTRRQKGARVRRRQWPGTWSWAANPHAKTSPAVMRRTGPARLPITVERIDIHATVLARLRGIERDAKARFDRLLTQELHYALNVEAQRA